MTPEFALSQLLEAEANLCAALVHSHDEHLLQKSFETISSVESQLSQACCNDLIDTKAWTPVANAVQRIQTFTASFCRQEADLSQCRKDIVDDFERLWPSQGPTSATSATRSRLYSQGAGPDPDSSQAPGAPSSSHHNEQSLNAVVMRRWMLDHIHHPFPNTQDKEDIAEETNKGVSGVNAQLRPEQATLWFINTRRRSGWTAWARRFANSDKTRLRAIVAAIQGKSLDWSDSRVKREDIEDSLEELVEAHDVKDRGLSKAQLAELCKAEFLKVTEWIEQGSKDKVGDWMDKVVSEAKANLKRKKQDRRAARKLLAERRRGRAAAATRDVEMVESEDELAEEHHPTQAWLGVRPIRHLPQQRTVSGASSSSSCLSSVVSGRLHHSGSSSSAATSFDSTYERGTSSGRCATDFQTESTGQHFQQMQVNDYQPKIEVCAPSPFKGLTRLPPFAAQQQSQAGQARLAYEGAQASSAYFQPPARSDWPAPTSAETIVYDQRNNDAQTFFMPSVTAAAALGNNWGMPVSSSGVDPGMTGQSEEVANYEGWLAWTGQMMTGEA